MAEDIKALTAEFVQKMQAMDYTDVEALNSTIAEYTTALTKAAATPPAPEYTPAANQEEFLARCAAFAQAIAEAHDGASIKAAFEKLYG